MLSDIHLDTSTNLIISKVRHHHWQILAEIYLVEHLLLIVSRNGLIRCRIEIGHPEKLLKEVWLHKILDL